MGAHRYCGASTLLAWCLRLPPGRRALELLAVTGVVLAIATGFPLEPLLPWALWAGVLHLAATLGLLALDRARPRVRASLRRRFEDHVRLDGSSGEYLAYMSSEPLLRAWLARRHPSLTHPRAMEVLLQ